METVPSVLDAAAERDGAHPLLRCDGRDTTVGELQRASRSVAGALRAWGLSRGDRVAIMMRNSPEFVAIWFGVVRAGCVEVPVHSAQRGPLLQHILAESGARVLFCEAEFAERLEGLELPELERVVVRGEDIDAALAHPPGADSPAAAGSDVSCILYTSGTTGPSKGVVLTHSANLQLAKANIALMEYTPDDVLYTAFPLFHVNAKFTSVTSSMIVGARLVLDDVFSA
jgi:crotonobetaine/carnitine-CoA ligase